MRREDIKPRLSLGASREGLESGFMGRQSGAGQSLSPSSGPHMKQHRLIPALHGSGSKRNPDAETLTPAHVFTGRFIPTPVPLSELQNPCGHFLVSCLSALAELVKINGIVQLEILPRLEDFTKLVEVTRTAAATDKVTDK